MELSSGLSRHRFDRQLGSPLSFGLYHGVTHEARERKVTTVKRPTGNADTFD